MPRDPATWVAWPTRFGRPARIGQTASVRLVGATTAALLAVGTITQLASPAPAAAAPGPPRPTSTAASPQAPDPHPPPGRPAPNGAIPGGSRLGSRGLVLPPQAPKLPSPLPAQSWLLSDLDTGEILAARDPHGRYQPASILKALTALTLLPKLPGRRIVSVSAAAAGAEGSAVGLLAGARYTVDQLFQALFLVSANDAAAALAEANGGAAATVRDMNAEAARIGAYDTVVQTPSGLDGWQQLTSAYDMSLVLRAALRLPRFAAYDRLAAATWPPEVSVTGQRVGVYEFDNQSENFLAGVPGALFAKTGYTDAALHTYLCAAQRDGRRLGLVFLRNQRTPIDQFQQAAALLNWGFALPRTTAAVGWLAGAIAADAPLSDGPGPSAVPTSATGSISPGSANRPASTTRSSRQARSALVLNRSAGAIAGVLLLGGAGAAGLRRRRRRSPRRR